MVLRVAMHKQTEPMMGKHPPGSESCFSASLHQDYTEDTSQEAKLPLLQTTSTRVLHLIRECKDLAMVLRISPAEESRGWLKKGWKFPFSFCSGGSLNPALSGKKENKIKSRPYCRQHVAESKTILHWGQTRDIQTPKHYIKQCFEFEEGC